MPSRVNPSSRFAFTQCAAEFDPDFGCFVLRRSVLHSVDRTPDDLHDGVIAEMEQIQRRPVPGLAKMLGIDAVDQGIFEVLPGKTLKEVVEAEAGLSPEIWHAVASELLKITARAAGRKNLELCFHPGTISIWRRSRNRINLGFGAFTFNLSQCPQKNPNLWDRWEIWTRQLASLWYFMATGQWQPDYEKLSHPKFFRHPNLARNPEIQRLLKAMLQSDPDRRVTDLDEIRANLATCVSNERPSAVPNLIEKRLTGLPRKDAHFPWMVEEQQLPNQAEVSWNHLDTAQPNLLPARHRHQEEAIRLHVIPPTTTLGLHHQQAVERAWNVCRMVGKKPFLALTDRWTSARCQFFAEKAPDGISLERLLDRADELTPTQAIAISYQVHQALTKAERHRLEIPSLDPTDVFLVPTESCEIDFQNLAWLEDRNQFNIHLRPLNAHHLHRSNPANLRADGTRQAISELVGNVPEGQFCEMVARLLGPSALVDSAVSAGLREAAYAESCDAKIRRDLLQYLRKVLVRGLSDAQPVSLASKIIDFVPVSPSGHRIDWKIAAGAAAAVLALGFLGIVMLGGGDPAMPYAEDDGQPVIPPENLLPVTIETASLPPDGPSSATP